MPPLRYDPQSEELRARSSIAASRNAGTPEDRERVEKELEDRYGPVPEAVRNLLEYSGLKTAGAMRCLTGSSIRRRIWTRRG